jgi:hypothetical protein
MRKRRVRPILGVASTLSRFQGLQVRQSPPFRRENGKSDPRSFWRGVANQPAASMWPKTVKPGSHVQRTCGQSEQALQGEAGLSRRRPEPRR